jgi:hypothetical protein
VFPLILKSTLEKKKKAAHFCFFPLFYNLQFAFHFEFSFVVPVKCHCLMFITVSASLWPFFSFNSRDTLSITGILLSSHNPHSIVGKIDGRGEKCTGKKN